MSCKTRNMAAYWLRLRAKRGRSRIHHGIFFQAKVQSETDATTANGVGFVACEHANKAIRKAAPQTDSSPLGKMIHQLADRVTNLRNISCLD